MYNDLACQNYLRIKHLYVSKSNPAINGTVTFSKEMMEVSVTKNEW
jgi:hypothetical protein